MKLLSVRTNLVCAALLVISIGCATVASSWPASIRYEPSSTTYYTAVTSEVGLRVVDARPPDRGAGSSRIGHAGGGFAGYVLVTREPGMAMNAVRDATADALRHNGVAVADGPRVVLVARVREFWFDGYRPSGRPMVEVDYQLADEAGTTLWSTTVSSQGSRSAQGTIHEADYVLGQTLGTALRGISTEARIAFQKEDFRELMKTRASIPPIE